MSLPEVMNGFQTLAWITWRSEAAVRRFSGDDAEALWARAKDVGLPELGKPTVLPSIAEMELRAAMTTRRVSFKGGDEPWKEAR